MARSAAAVFVAAVVMAAVVVAGTMGASGLLAGAAGEPTASYLVANLAVSFAAAVVGGWLAARLAPRRPLLHAAVLGLLIVLLSAPSLSSPAAGQPVWYPTAVVLIGVGGVAAGAMLRRLLAGMPRLDRA